MRNRSLYATITELGPISLSHDCWWECVPVFHFCTQPHVLHILTTKPRRVHVSLPTDDCGSHRRVQEYVAAMQRSAMQMGNETINYFGINPLIASPPSCTVVWHIYICRISRVGTRVACRLCILCSFFFYFIIRVCVECVELQYVGRPCMLHKFHWYKKCPS